MTADSSPYFSDNGPYRSKDDCPMHRVSSPYAEAHRDLLKIRPFAIPAMNRRGYDVPNSENSSETSQFRRSKNVKYLKNWGLTGIFVGILMVLAACAPGATPLPPTTVPTQPPPPTAVPPAPTAAAPAAPVAKAVTLELVKNDTLGNILADGDGNILYLFTKDTPNVSNCYDKCLAAWPAVYPDGAPTLKEGLNQTLVGTTTRKDGSTQLTYNGWPLYYYAKDQKPGDVVGQAVGNVWWVISGEGNPIRPASIQVSTDAKLGKILTDANGMTLYMFTKDTKDTTNCYDKCEVAWPPLLTLDKPKLGDGIDAALIGTTTRKDGTTQVTYNGLPLYYYTKDTKAGDTIGQNVGTVWFVVGPDGSAIKTGS